jgi:hypothetical protein
MGSCLVTNPDTNMGSARDSRRVTSEGGYFRQNGFFEALKPEAYI